MARSPARPIRPVGCRGDEHGQMMVLSAVLLVISFVALAAMVGRVNQLGSQTASESRKVILDEVGPLADSMNSAIRSFGGVGTSTLARTVAVTWAANAPQITGPADTVSFYPEDVGRHVTGTNVPATATILSYQSSRQVTLSDSPTSGTGTTVTIGRVTATIATTGVVTPSSSFFKASDVGQALTQVTGTGLPAGARIISIDTAANPDTVTISPAPTSALASQSFNIGDFALMSTTTPTIETAIVGMLEQMQSLVASRGLWLDYEVECGAGNSLTTSVAKIRLFDGQVSLTIQSTETFTRSTTPCTTIIGTDLP